MSLTSTVPPVVPSVLYSSHPATPSSCERNTVLPAATELQNPGNSPGPVFRSVIMEAERSLRGSRGSMTELRRIMAVCPPLKGEKLREELHLHPHARATSAGTARQAEAIMRRLSRNC